MGDLNQGCSASKSPLTTTTPPCGVGVGSAVALMSTPADSKHAGGDLGGAQSGSAKWNLIILFKANAVAGGFSAKGWEQSP